MTTPFLSNRIYSFLFALLGLVYLFGLFVPLMDNDSAHHANIALRMFLTGDYITLSDYGRDYLDKPHLHFWLCIFSYKIFGVTTFAYKFPSFLFTLLGTYSTYRIGKGLYDTETGKLASLIIASAFAYILANNDVRMDAILTACIAFSLWQLIAFVQQKKMIRITGAALGLALGFSTKGHIAVLVPAIGVFFYILYLKEWKLFLSWKWLLLIFFFFLFISPVVYSYYVQYNLHPEKTVRGKDHINGVKFILLNQSIERFSGEMGHDAQTDYFFFLHSFLWAFAPWSILAYIAFATRIKSFLGRKEEWLTVGVFITILLVVSFSHFKLPHYLNIVFPTTAVLTANFILGKRNKPGWIKSIFTIQLIVAFIIMVFIGIITLWAFPVKQLSVILFVIIYLAVFFYFIRSAAYNQLQKAVCLSVSSIAFTFFLLNANLYPQLLTYQGGNMLAAATKEKVNTKDVYFWTHFYSTSYNFYTKTIHVPFTDSLLQPGKTTWIMFDGKNEDEIKAAGYKLGKRFTTPDYEITRLTLKFINPSARDSQCTKMVMAEISR